MAMIVIRAIVFSATSLNVGLVRSGTYFFAPLETEPPSFMTLLMKCVCADLEGITMPTFYAP